MPIYRYACKCGKQFDEFRKIVNRHDDLVCVCGLQAELKIMPTSVKADIQPYMSAAVDKETGKRVFVESSKQHRDFLRRNDYVEIGNDFGTPKKHDDGPADSPMLSVEEMKAKGFVEEAL